VQRILRSASTIFWLGTKELRSFLRDTVLIVLVIYTFSLAVISQAQSNSQELNKASIAVADEDNSPLSRRIMHAFLPPLFLPPQPMNAGHFTFVVDFRGRFGIRVKLITGPCGPTSNACPRRLTFLDR
jgi:ABC-2 type transport system permease protein